jgi:HTH-type transcriptional regulator/antitoxin HigA
MKALEIDAVSIESAWTAFEQTVGNMLPIRSARQYQRAVRLTNALLDVVGADERHPIAGLLDVLADLVSAYEAREVPMPDAQPREALRMLMNANGLTQAELGAELGGQPVVSAILNGKRAINARQASALASRFGVSAAVFIS